MRTEIGHVRMTKAERIKDITRLTKELEKSQKETSLEEEIILLKPRRSQEELTTQRSACSEVVEDGTQIQVLRKIPLRDKHAPNLEKEMTTRRSSRMEK